MVAEWPVSANVCRWRSRTKQAREDHSKTNVDNDDALDVPNKPQTNRFSRSLALVSSKRTLRK